MYTTHTQYDVNTYFKYLYCNTENLALLNPAKDICIHRLREKIKIIKFKKNNPFWKDVYKF